MEQLLVPRIKAAEMLGISVKTLDRLTQAGEIRRVKIRSRVCYSVDELKAFTQKEGPLC